MKHGKFSRVLALALAAAMMLSACGSSTPAPEDTGGEQQNEQQQRDDTQSDGFENHGNASLFPVWPATQRT